MVFRRNTLARRILSPVALAAVASLGTVAWQAPAVAQKKGDKKDQPAAAKANYSKEFVAAYKPMEPLVNSATPDIAALKAGVPAIVAAATTPDDKMAAGRMLFTVGQKSNDMALSLQGAEMVLASGKADPKLQGQFSFVAAQFAYNLKDYPKARTHVQNAINAGYTDNDPEVLLAETYFAEKQYAEGLRYLTSAVEARKAAGKPASEAMIERGWKVAYQNKLNADARKWALMHVADYPSQTTWGNAVAIAINTGQYDRPEMLDLLRLARRTDGLRAKALYLEYIDAADARKLPSEVMAVIDAGLASKVIDSSIPLVKDARTVATTRMAADKAELPALIADANKPGAKLVTVMAAADTTLSYGRNAEAEKLYAKALTLPGANADMVLTRMGIAQLDQGKTAEARATFAKVKGNRQSIAELWSLHAAQKAGPATATAALTPAPAAPAN